MKLSSFFHLACFSIKTILLRQKNPILGTIVLTDNFHTPYSDTAELAMSIEEKAGCCDTIALPSMHCNGKRGTADRLNSKKARISGFLPLSINITLSGRHSRKGGMLKPSLFINENLSPNHIPSQSDNS